MPRKTTKSSEPKLESGAGTASSKRDQLLAMLRAADGATVDEMAAALGWQKHSIRGFLAATVKKKLGLPLTSDKEERGRVYRLAEGL